MVSTVSARDPGPTSLNIDADNDSSCWIIVQTNAPEMQIGDRRTSGGRNILDQERFKSKKPQVGYPACFSTLALSQIEAKLLLAGI